jgi:hypothetical protein
MSLVTVAGLVSLTSAIQNGSSAGVECMAYASGPGASDSSTHTKATPDLGKTQPA